MYKPMLEDIKDILRVMATVMILPIIGLILLTPLFYFNSCTKASVYNKINQTEFTCWEFFWAEDQINSNSQTIKIKQ